jgi:hypothetical protein
MQKVEATREQMFKMIGAWQQSGLSQKSFCEQNDIRYHVFHYWYKCFRDLQSTTKPEGFKPIKIQSFPSTNTVFAHTELLLPDGKCLVFHQAVSSDYLKHLIS